MISSRIDHDCRNELNNVELKATPARIAILKVLEKSDKPLDVATIIDFLDKQEIKTDPATVFRIMNKFTDSGLANQVSFNEGKSRYEVASKPDHHHLICEKCGIIEDISDCKIDVLEKYIEKKKKFRVIRHSLEFFGLCKSCQN